ncbi:MAG TPA: DUF6178 family protein [Geobacteraceae bacterium]|nr:DUF6178 family protein [Geobacteraceae bacterium]
MRTTENDKTTITLIAGGRLTSTEFAKLPTDVKIDCLLHLNGSNKASMILDDPNPELLVQALPMWDIFQIIHELGAENAIDIFQLATPDQVRFILDLELWEDWTISVEETVKWIEIILSTGEENALRLLSVLDQELLILFLRKTLSVGGGLDDIINSEDHLGAWDHTFDEIFFLNIHDEEHSELTLKFLEFLYNEDHRLYRSLMLGTESELTSELEEVAGQFRAGRLADEGLPASIDGAEYYERRTN